ncbi:MULTISPECIES: carboxypeptidase-like regulatory domain-containing protein [unclassified Paenibacillus]|uniref:carboxypeptidase-like regulatory domain-containing protein n=1 Tax=unclassified Paenibacillus TaxID=185978 RepID=UPI0015E47A86|nr:MULTISPECIES: carboxypeptidase-like regulatory domain-containing protein [unclassified Paenibacillus]
MIHSPKGVIQSFMLCIFTILLYITYAETSHAAGSAASPSNYEDDINLPAVVNGKVTDRGGYVVPHANVEYELNHLGEITKYSTVADENGNYHIEAVVRDSTDMYLYVSADGFITYISYNKHDTFTLRPGDEVKHDIQLYEPSTIIGTVKDQTGQPIAGAKIEVTSVPYLVETDENGRYTVTGIDYDYSANIAIWVDSDNYVPYVEDRLGIRAGETIQIDVVLEAAAHVRGQVVDENGVPISGVIISGNPTRTTTDAHGYFILRRTMAGSVALAADFTGYPRHIVLVDLVPGDHNTVNFVLKKNP